MFTFVSFKNTRAVTPYIEIIIVSVYIDEGLHAASQYIYSDCPQFSAVVTSVNDIRQKWLRSFMLFYCI